MDSLHFYWPSTERSDPSPSVELGFYQTYVSRCHVTLSRSVINSKRKKHLNVAGHMLKATGKNMDLIGLTMKIRGPLDRPSWNLKRIEHTYSGPNRQYLHPMDSKHGSLPAPRLLANISKPMCCCGVESFLSAVTPLLHVFQIWKIWVLERFRFASILSICTLTNNQWLRFLDLF